MGDGPHSPIPNPQSPIPNPQSPIFLFIIIFKNINFMKKLLEKINI
jgi:hypothetical protein